MEIILAKYNENIDWVKQNNFHTISTVYCKGKKDDFDHKDYHRIISLPNVGREGHTYLHHIIENYDNLSDINIFIQAHPFDHCPRAIKVIQDIINKKTLFDGYQSFPTFILPIHNLMCKSLPNILDIKRICEEIFINPPNLFHAWTNGLFVVSKSTILMRSKNFYKKCLGYLDHSSDPIEGHVFERIWGLIFNNDIKTLL